MAAVKYGQDVSNLHIALELLSHLHIFIVVVTVIIIFMTQLYYMLNININLCVEHSLILSPSKYKL